MPKFDALIEGYLAYLTSVGRKRPRTVIDVRCTLGRAVSALQAIRPGVPLWHLGLQDYLRWLTAERERGCTSASLAKYVSHVRGLLEYAWRSGRAERNVLDGFRLQDETPRSAPKYLDLDQARRLVEACPRATAAERRDRLIVLLLYGCGLRTAELCALNATDINRERQELQVLKGKGERARCLPIPHGVYLGLLEYLLAHPKRGALFRTAQRGRRISAKDVCEVVRRAVERAHLDRGVTARTLRHSFATHLMDRGVDLGIIASLMGHRSPQETGVYLHALPGRREHAVKTLIGGEAP
ncbi:MAG TPA: tyrosine-type recombinase/integrase [Burkholderiales bacterium]|nr:tyrosine-type recombinase/integrase [Burkholderiales bacterium]